jgi:hypothetical protein
VYERPSDRLSDSDTVSADDFVWLPLTPHASLFETASLRLTAWPTLLDSEYETASLTPWLTPTLWLMESAEPTVVASLCVVDELEPDVLAHEEPSDTPHEEPSDTAGPEMLSLKPMLMPAISGPPRRPPTFIISGVSVSVCDPPWLSPCDPPAELDEKLPLVYAVPTVCPWLSVCDVPKPSDAPLDTAWVRVTPLE